jgi:hypothetical protein
MPISASVVLMSVAATAAILPGSAIPVVVSIAITLTTTTTTAATLSAPEIFVRLVCVDRA